MTMMVLAIRLYDVGLRDDAVFWFYVAKDRTIVLSDVLNVKTPQLAQADDERRADTEPGRPRGRVGGRATRIAAASGAPDSGVAGRLFRRMGHEVIGVQRVAKGANPE